MIRVPVLLGSALLLSACVSIDAEVTPSPQVCPTGLAARTTAELFFGRNIGDALGVSEAAWREFLDQEVTPRFPAGLTVLDAAGQWRGEGGGVVREPSKLLLIVLSGAPGEAAKLDAVRQAYKVRFRQDAVMIVRREACVGF